MNKLILVIDDSPLMVDIITDTLSIEPFDIITASDGEEGLEKAFSKKPDLIILDIEMPKVNGYTVCKKLKSNPKTNKITILMQSTKDKATDKIWAKGMGADAYLVKPFNPDDLITKVRELLK